jgi:hypothetical protein
VLLKNFRRPDVFSASRKIDRKTVMDAEYVVILSREVDDYVDEQGGRIPNLLAGKGFSAWLEAPTLRAIVLDRIGRDAK